jgi:hypothetical protein
MAAAIVTHLDDHQLSEVLVAMHGTLTHRKTRRLAAKLHIDLSHALGIIEAMLHVAAGQLPYPDGGIGRMSNQDIADEMFVRRINAEKLINAMLFAGQLEPNENCRLYIHDFHEHCWDSIDVHLARNVVLYANGRRPRMTKLRKEEREPLEALYLRAAKIQKAAK